MLLSVGLPKLVTKSKPKKEVSSTTSKVFVDDTISVKQRMDELFSGYNWKVVTTEEELKQYVADKTELGFDTETTGLDPFRDELVGFSLGTVDDCIYVPLHHAVGQNYQDDVAGIYNILRSKDLYGFNAKFDLKMFRTKLGFNLKAKWCGYLAARVMNSLEPSNDLKGLYVKYVDPDAQFYTFKSLFKSSFDKYDPAIVGAYGAVDAMKHIALAKWQEAHIDPIARKLLEKLELPLMHHLVDIELTGIKLDIDWCNQLTEQLQSDLDKARESIQRNYCGLNPGSNKQVQEYLFGTLGLPDVSGSGKVDESVLASLKHPLAEKILEYRKAQKLLSTYAGKMPKLAVDGVVHCDYNQCGADTGRFSSRNPNLQNIPKDNRFRKMFVAREGCTLVSCDYTQQEVYILAALAGDESMKQAYATGMDFYAYMASIVFDMPYEQCVKHGPHGELRNQMKSIVLGLNYDMGLKSLARDIGKSVEETKAIYFKFFEKCPKVKEFRQKNLEFAKKNGYVETILGRKRYFSCLHLPDFACTNKDVLLTLNKLKSESAIAALIKDAKAEGIEVIDRRNQKVYETRQVVNSIIQGSAADMTKLAIIQACEDPELKALGCKVLLQIHDEIIAEFPDENAEKGGQLLANLMVDVGSDLIGIKMVCTPTLMKVWEKD